MIGNQGTKYESLIDVAIADMVDGEVKTVGAVVGSAIGNVKNGEQYSLMYKCNKAKCSKDSTVSITLGQIVYYNSTNKNITNVSTGNTKVGFAIESKGIGTDSIIIDFNGTLGV
jgi:predicted RecA/RadA family phage recombinase